jgi:prepilin-type processing-associated H-X9-DG protein
MQMVQARRPPNDPERERLHPQRVNTISNDWGCYVESSMTSSAPSPSPNHRPNLNLPCGGADVPNNWRRQGVDGFATSRSRHHGGVNVLFCDGRVQFIGDSIDSSTTSPYGTWQRMAWIDDGQQVELP